MKAKNTDEYIGQCADFAQPIMVHLRQLVHETIPGIEEQIKWMFPCFMYKGKILCHIAGFKHHCVFGFWQGSIMKDPHHVFQKNEENAAMGQFGKITSLADLPNASILKEYLHEAADLIDQGKTVPKKPSATKKHYEMPVAFQEAMESQPKALTFFQSLSASKKREFLEHICEAKQEATQVRRIEKSLKLLLQGHDMGTKYS